MARQTPHNCNVTQLRMSVAQTDNHVAKCDKLKKIGEYGGGGVSFEKKKTCITGFLWVKQ